MTLRNVPKSYTLEQQRLEINEIAVDLDTAIDGVQTFGGSKTFSSDVTFQGTVDFDDIATFNSSPTFSDNVVANFGDDADLKIYYDGSVGVLTSFIDSDALQIRSKTDPSELYATALKDGPVELYYDGAKKIATSLTGAAVLGDLEVNDELHSATGTFILKTADQITPGQMVTEAVFGGSMYVPYGFSTYPITYFPGGGIGETSTNDGITITNGGQIYISNSGGSALWKGRQTGTAGITSEIDAPGNATFAGTVTASNFSGPVTGNADTATSLQTARNIAGNSFDGTVDITIAATDLSDTDQALATTSDVTFNTITKSGGLSTEFLKADGSVDSTTYLSSYTETDPVVGAITGIVKADGAGNISAAVAGTDYATAAQGALADTALQAETITLTTLKAEVAASVDFADFQSRIAAL